MPATAADVSHGNAVFEERCARCHAISPSEPGKRGPYLAGLFQRAPGAVKGFPYRMVYTDAGPIWTEKALDNYLVIHLLPEAVDRADVIAFLKDITAKVQPSDK
ncbi:MAG TPA: c-type cytochrome [Stellaceae bacterium]|nr:c-type cytochrome [Stellaceae bacterium]